MDFREEELKEKLSKKMFAVIDDKRISESVKKRLRIVGGISFLR